MPPDYLEKWVRAVGALALVPPLFSIGLGLGRSWHHRKGRATQDMPAFARVLTSGSPALYVPASAAGLAILFRLWRPLPLRLPASARLAALVLGALLYFPGLALILWGRLTLGRMHNVSTGLGVQLYADHRLISSGPYALVRHPMYVGGVMAELGSLLLYRTWTTLLAALNALALIARARREEEVLAAEFGEQWTEYARRVPAWVPRWR